MNDTILEELFDEPGVLEDGTLLALVNDREESA